MTDLGAALADTASGTPAWLLGDHQGSITGVADTTTLTGSTDLDPYESPTGADTGDYADNPLRFHGQYLDHTTGLYDVRARDYDATTGRFTSPDPIAAAADTAFTQTYHYGYNRPTVLTDPTGECPIICTAIIGGVAGAAVGGIDCWLSGDDRNTCLTKIAVGAAAGALTGATLGAGGSAAAGLYGGVSTGTQIAGGIVAGGAGSVLYGSGVAAATGQPYSYGNAAYDFLSGAAGSAGGVAAGTVAQRAAARTAGIQAANCPPASGVSLWTTWAEYPKVFVDRQQYARIGGRLYTRHAVDRMQPSGLRYSGRPGPDEGGLTGGMPQIRQAGGDYDYGRGVSPNWVEYVIRSTRGTLQDNGNFSHVLGTLQVIVSPKGRVVTVITH
ncbi:RHS repeat-associated core domain-containing protein [Solwaraspora sp. WMMB335]|uniref:RHS repeat-associated core domain-containing protein n=1 Tax=Solwaraspora sp. WMMB335 TaxID=3404118 RepID=UPI003B95E862